MATIIICIIKSTAGVTGSFAKGYKGSIIVYCPSLRTFITNIMIHSLTSCASNIIIEIRGIVPVLPANS